MADAQKDLNTSVTTPTFRVSYPSVFQPRYNKLSKKNEYSLEGLFEFKKDSPEMASLKAAANNACIKKWGPDQSKWPKPTAPKVFQSPFKDQVEKAKDGKQPEGTTAGNVFMRFKCDSTKHKPAVVDNNRQEIIEESKFYAGCYARANVNAFAYNEAGNIGVSFGLNALQFVKDGQPFSGRPTVEEAFEPIAASPDTSGSGGGDATSLF